MSRFQPPNTTQNKKKHLKHLRALPQNPSQMPRRWWYVFCFDFMKATLGREKRSMDTGSCHHGALDSRSRPQGLEVICQGRSATGDVKDSSNDWSYQILLATIMYIINICIYIYRIFIHSFIHSFIRSFVRSFVPSFIHSFIHSFIQSINQSIKSCHVMSCRVMSFHFISFHFIRFIHFIH